MAHNDSRMLRMEAERSQTSLPLCAGQIYRRRTRDGWSTWSESRCSVLRLTEERSRALQRCPSARFAVRLRPVLVI
jgi:hypothetical protein